MWRSGTAATSTETNKNTASLEDTDDTNDTAIIDDTITVNIMVSDRGRDRQPRRR